MFPPYHGVLCSPRAVSSVEATAAGSFTLSTGSATRQYDQSLQHDTYVWDNPGGPTRTRRLVDVSSTWAGPKFEGLESYTPPPISFSAGASTADIEEYLQSLADDFNSQPFVDTGIITLDIPISVQESGESGSAGKLVLQYVPQKSATTSYKRYNSVQEAVSAVESTVFILTPGYFRILEEYENPDNNVSATVQNSGSYSRRLQWSSSELRMALSLPAIYVIINYVNIPTLDELSILVVEASPYSTVGATYLSANVTGPIGIMPAYEDYRGPLNKPGDIDNTEFWQTSYSAIGATQGGYTLLQNIDAQRSNAAPIGSSFYFSKVTSDFDANLGVDILTTHEVHFDNIEGTVYTDSSSVAPYLVPSSLHDTLQSIAMSGEGGFTGAYFEVPIVNFQCTAYLITNDEGSPATGVHYPYTIGEVVDSGIFNSSPNYVDGSYAVDSIDYAILNPTMLRVILLDAGTNEAQVTNYIKQAQGVTFDINH